MPAAGFFEDFEVGVRYPTRVRTITDADHEAFCRLVGYEVPMFLDDAYAKRRGLPGRICPSHLIMSFSTAMTGDLFQDVSGDVQLVLSGIGTMLPQVKGGRLKGFAVTSAARSPLAPEIPTVVESGLAGYAATTWYGVLAPPEAFGSFLRAEVGKWARVVRDTGARAE